MARAVAKYQIQADDKTTRGTKSAKKNFMDVDKAVAGLRIGLLAGTAAAVGIGAAVMKTSKSFDELAKNAKRLGIAVDQLDAWNYVMQLGGSSSDAFAKSIRTLTRYMFDVSVGAGGEAKQAFEALGIAVENADGKLKESTSVMLEAADAIKDMESSEERLAVAQKIFGRSGAELIPILEQGSDAIRDQLIEAQVLGTRYGDMTAKGEDVVDSQLRISRAARNVGDAIMVHALPGIASLTDWLSIQLVNALTNTDAEFRRFIASLRIGDPSFAVKDLTAELDTANAQLATLKQRWLDTYNPAADTHTLLVDSPLESQIKDLEGMIPYIEHQLALAKEQLAIQERIQSQQRDRRAVNDMVMSEATTLEELTGAYEAGKISIDQYIAALDRRIAASENIPMPKTQVIIEAVDGFEELETLAPPADLTEGIRLLNEELAALIYQQELAGDVFDTVWNSMAQGPEAMGKALMKLGIARVGEALKKKLLGKLSRKRAGVETELASAKLWSAYAGIPVVGPGIASGLIATMIGEIKGAGAAIGAAAEGSNYASGPMLVGERGPEIVNFRTPGQVIPNHEIGNVGGGNTYVLQVNGDLINDETSRDNLARDVFERGMRMGVA